MKTLLESVLLYIFYMCLFLALCLGIKFSVNLVYESGKQAGITEAVARSAAKVEEARKQAEVDKERIEKNAQSKINAATLDAVNSRAANDKLRKELDRIRSIARGASPVIPASASTFQAVDMLADMLFESNRAANDYAEFADKTFNAGTTCENQYDSLRKNNVKEANVK